MGVGALSTERVLDYADLWRTLARRWADMAGKGSDPHAATLRHMAQMALFAAYEAEQLFKARDQRSCEPAPPIARMSPTPSRAGAAPSSRRHGPVRYFAALGPVSLAGQRPRVAGAYSTRIAGWRA